MKSRILILFLLSIGLWGVVVLRAAHMQIIPNPRLTELQQRQFRKIVTLPPRRGGVVDRNGLDLAVTVPSYSLFADPKLIEAPRATARRLARELRQPYENVYRRLKNPKRRFVWLKRQLNEADKDKISSWRIRGLAFVEEPKRIYPNSNLLSQVMGFVGSDGRGLEGLELKYNEPLQGDTRRVDLRRDARGRPLLVNGRIFADNPDGSHLALTIDRELQFKLEDELRSAVVQYNADNAMGVIMDPRTSEVLAMANVPDFDLNRPGQTQAINRRNRVVTDAFEPGSTMKTILIAGAMRAGVIRPNTKIDCEGGQMKVGKRIIREADEHHRFGLLTVSEILAFSSNVGTSKIAFKMGDELVRKTLADFGFGQRLGVDLPGEVEGTLHPVPWNPHLLANVSFGHGVTATALQVAAAYSAIAGDGVLRQPHVVKSIVHGENESRTDFGPKEIRRVLSADEAARMRLLLVGVTSNQGSGFRARIPGYPVGGKTGTAQKVNPTERGYLPKAYISSFVGFVPATEPRYVIYVVIDNPRNQYYGSQVAAPVFSRVGAFAMRKSGVAPILITNQDVLSSTQVASQKMRRRAIESLQQEMAPVEEGRVPDLTGLTLREAMQRALPLNIVLRARGSGVISRSSPAPGEELPRSKVLRVELGERAFATSL